MVTKLENTSNEIHITTHDKRGKLEGLRSVNTSVEQNPFCQALRQQTGTICKSCFACPMEARYSRFRAKIKNNFDLLTSVVVPVDRLPRIWDRYFRLHSVGELVNLTHFQNFVNLATVNPDTRFTLWTKNRAIVNEWVKINGLPPFNLTLVYSSPMLNHEEILPAYFDKVFTVYDRETITAENISINCGGKKCKDCMLCYSQNDVVYIREQKKLRS